MPFVVTKKRENEEWFLQAPLLLGQSPFLQSDSEPQTLLKCNSIGNEPISSQHWQSIEMLSRSISAEKGFNAVTVSLMILSSEGGIPVTGVMKPSTIYFQRPKFQGRLMKPQLES